MTKKTMHATFSRSKLSLKNTKRLMLNLALAVVVVGSGVGFGGQTANATSTNSRPHGFSYETTLAKSSEAKMLACMQPGGGKIYFKYVIKQIREGGRYGGYGYSTEFPMWGGIYGLISKRFDVGTHYGNRLAPPTNFSTLAVYVSPMERMGGGPDIFRLKDISNCY